MWRKGWQGNDGKTVELCNACGILFKRGWICLECYEVYRKEVDVHQDWLSCDYCPKWSHFSW